MADRKKRAAKRTAPQRRKKTTPQVKQQNKYATAAFWRGFFFGQNAQKRVEVVSSDRKPTGYAPFFTALAIVLIALIAFVLGSVHNSVCQVTYSPNLGTLKYVAVMTPKNQTNLWTNLLPIEPKPMNPSSLQTQVKQPYLFTVQGQSLRVVSNNLNLSSIDGQDIILTGQVSPCSHTLVLDTLKNITIIPRQTTSAVQTTPSQ